MPFLKSITVQDNINLYIWKITESSEDLKRDIVLNEHSIERLMAMKSERHRKGFMSIRKLLMEIGYTDADLYYDEFGKPFLKDGVFISISHSHDFALIALSDSNIGVDVEILREKILSVAPRYMNISQLSHLSNQDKVKKATIIWGIKEAVFKLKNKSGISFKEHIKETNFNLSDKKCSVEFQIQNEVAHFDIIFEAIENYYFVCAFEKKKNS